ncbi:hypothetical protein RUND412_010018 [Rhizina undulata]
MAEQVLVKHLQGLNIDLDKLDDVKPPEPIREEFWGDDEEEDEEEPIAPHNSRATQGVKKKKKKNKRTKGERKAAQPTGFEEYSTDGPMTAKQFAYEANNLYSLDMPFNKRMDNCVQQYKLRRRFDPVRLQIFSAYLNLGGVSIGTKVSAAKSDDEVIMPKMTGEVERYGDDDEEWDVDFVYVVRGFLSHKVPYVLGYLREEDLILAPKVIRNFLAYVSVPTAITSLPISSAIVLKNGHTNGKKNVKVVYHNVTPENDFSLRAALKICDLAEKELPLCRKVSMGLPGPFSMACSTLFGGYYRGMRDDDDKVTSDVGLRPKDARVIFIAGLQRRGTKMQKEGGLHTLVYRKQYLGLEVVGIVYPVADADDYEAEAWERAVSKDVARKDKTKYCGKGSRALGKLLVNSWAPEDEDPPEEMEFEIWVEKALLKSCFVGMHLEGMVYWLSNGVVWLDVANSVLCSFYLHLETPDIDQKKASDFD